MNRYEQIEDWIKSSSLSSRKNVLGYERIWTDMNRLKPEWNIFSLPLDGRVAIFAISRGVGRFRGNKRWTDERAAVCEKNRNIGIKGISEIKEKQLIDKLPFFAFVCCLLFTNISLAAYLCRICEFVQNNLHRDYLPAYLFLLLEKRNSKSGNAVDRFICSGRLLAQWNTSPTRPL